MPVKIWTGLPGAGKTARMIAAILEFKQREPDRPVFAININGLDPSVAEPLTHDQLRKWWELPPGALIAIDECQEDEYFPLDRGQPPEWVKRISKVRHEGMDFWLATQHPNLMSAYVRRLVDQHVHCVRKFNTKVCSTFTWGRCMESCEKGSAQKVATHSVGAIPSHVFDLYKSSNAHNMKARIPLKAMVLPVAAVVAVAALVAVPVVLKRMQHAQQAAISTKAGPAAAASTGRPSLANQDEDLRRSDPAKWMAPRVDGLPWTAPMFDHLQVKTVPHLFCMASDDGRCICHTEQGTRYAVPVARCRSIVAEGLYNPFAEGLAAEREQRQVERAGSGEPKAPTPPATPPEAYAATGGRRDRSTARPYTPPTYGDWNADPWGGSSKH